MVMLSSGVPGEIKVLLNHIYEFKKGVRNLVLYTVNKCYEPIAVERLESQGIEYIFGPLCPFGFCKYLFRAFGMSSHNRIDSR